MTSIASGGIPGLGAGEGNLSDVAAASTDLVFGMLAEEWGLVIAVLSVLCIITLAVFAYRSIIAGRSTYYCIAACAATSMFMFQAILNVFGSVDLLPLTGVTFPFVSSGGTSMIVSWGMLAFLKAAEREDNGLFDNVPESHQELTQLFRVEHVFIMICPEFHQVADCIIAPLSKIQDLNGLTHVQNENLSALGKGSRLKHQ